MELTLNQVIMYAKSTELKNFEVINNYEDLCNIINLVLIELHARFVLNEKVIKIPLEKDKTTYNLQDYL